MREHKVFIDNLADLVSKPIDWRLEILYEDASFDFNCPQYDEYYLKLYDSDIWDTLFDSMRMSRHFPITSGFDDDAPYCVRIKWTPDEKASLYCFVSSDYDDDRNEYEVTITGDEFTRLNAILKDDLAHWRK